MRNIKAANCFRISRTTISIFLLNLAAGFEAESQVPSPATDSLVYEAARILSEYVQYASVTGNEREAGNYISSKCSERGLHIEIFTDSTGTYNFAASLYPLDLLKPNIIFLSHIDVVSGGIDSLWLYPPFSGEISGDTVWGRGTIDMKGAAVMHLFAVSSFVERAAIEDFPVNITLLLVSGEEAYGITGANVICETVLPQLNAAVVVGEGGIGTTGLLSERAEVPVFAISLNEKRALWLDLELDFNASGHGAVPPPDYAVSMMIKSLYELVQSSQRIKYNQDNKAMLKAYGELEGGMTGFLLRHPALFKPLVAGGLKKNPLMASAFTNTITVTHISSEETALNQIPRRVQACLDCRLLPETSTIRFLEDLIFSLDNDRVSVKIKSETRNAPSTLPDGYYVMLTESITETYPGCGIIPVLFPATTDNNYFRNNGIPVYGVIPVIVDQELLKTIHTYNERLPVDALIKGIEVYSRFIGKLILGKSQEDYNTVPSDH